MSKAFRYDPNNFDGKKFAQRYGLDAWRGDFWADDKFVYVKDGVELPDDPPVFEAPDPAPATRSIQERLDEVKDIRELVALLKEVLR